MANPEHVEIVRQGAEAISAFQEKNWDVWIDLSGANLNGANLSNAELRRANLICANLSNAELIGANLKGADLIGADLIGANLSGSYLSDSNLSFADLRRANLSFAELMGADLRRADLIGADLGRANLSLADLRRANLSDSNLSFADLICADLSFADLRCANLRRANLSDAKLSGANLSGAYLTRANLSRANLSDADLSDADLSDADLSGTVFANIDLSQAIGLKEVNHSGPSTIGVDTLFLSNGKIPEIFLRGCGLPDDFIAYVPSFVGNAFDFYSCFISYNHEDKQFARQLHDRLQGKGIRCWLDQKQLKPDKIYKDVDRGLRVWDKVLLCCSDNSLKSWWVNREITTAIEKEREFYEQHGEEIWKIIPLNLDGSLFKWTGEHGAVIRQRLAADFTNWKSDADKFDSQFERVVKALQTDGGKSPEPTPKLPKLPK